MSHFEGLTYEGRTGLEEYLPGDEDSGKQKNKGSEVASVFFLGEEVFYLVTDPKEVEELKKHLEYNGFDGVFLSKGYDPYNEREFSRYINMSKVTDVLFAPEQ